MTILKESKEYHPYKRLAITVLENNWTRRATKRDLSILVGNTFWETLSIPYVKVPVLQPENCCFGFPVL